MFLLSGSLGFSRITRTLRQNIFVNPVNCAAVLYFGNREKRFRLYMAETRSIYIMNSTSPLWFSAGLAGNDCDGGQFQRSKMSLLSRHHEAGCTISPLARYVAHTFINPLLEQGARSDCSPFLKISAKLIGYFVFGQITSNRSDFHTTSSGLSLWVFSIPLIRTATRKRIDEGSAE